MLVNTRGTLNATIRLEEDGSDIVALSGSLDADGRYSVNRYIYDRATYKANRAIILKEEEAFEDILVNATALDDVTEE